jgi:hypothetical protein
MHVSLQKNFPALRENQAIEWAMPIYAHGATANRLKQSSNRPNQHMVDLANVMIAEVLHGKEGLQPDLLLVIDDLELSNSGQEDVVVRHFRMGIEEAIRRSPKFREQEEVIRKLLRERCSFHLLKPMVEAYLFGDGAAMQRITDKKPHLPPELDWEAFITNDPAYLPRCLAISAGHRIPGWREECHPKHYLQFLCPDYSETRGGRIALESLNWPVVGSNGMHVPVIRALFMDLAHWFGVENPLPGQTHPVFWPSQPNDLILRNI